MPNNGRAAPAISIIVPVLHDGPALAHLLGSLPLRPDHEVIVADGAADPAVAAACAPRPDVRVIQAPAGRGSQMNAGAKAARGDWLLFLHADSALPPGWAGSIMDAGREGAVGGWFRFALDDRAWQARVLERLVAWRVAVLSLPYGDQGYFVRRDAFSAMGGFRDLPLMEDVEFVRRLVRTGPVRPSPLPLVTSARRWRRDGWFRRSARNACLLGLYALGVAPATLARLYGAPGGRSS